MPFLLSDGLLLCLPTLWSDWFGNSQLLMGHSNYIVTLLRYNGTLGHFLNIKTMTLFQKSRGTHCDFEVSVHYQIYMASLSTMTTPLDIKDSSMSCGQVTVLMVLQSVSAALPSFYWDPHK